MKQPKGLTYKAEYEPDMTRMVHALRVLLEYPKGGESGHVFWSDSGQVRTKEVPTNDRGGGN